MCRFIVTEYRGCSHRRTQRTPCAAMQHQMVALSAIHLPCGVEDESVTYSDGVCMKCLHSGKFAKDPAYKAFFGGLKAGAKKGIKKISKTLSKKSVDADYVTNGGYAGATTANNYMSGALGRTGVPQLVNAPAPSSSRAYGPSPASVKKTVNLGFNQPTPSSTTPSPHRNSKANNPNRKPARNGERPPPLPRTGSPVPHIVTINTTPIPIVTVTPPTPPPPSQQRDETSAARIGNYSNPLGSNAPGYLASMLREDNTGRLVHPNSASYSNNTPPRSALTVRNFSDTERHEIGRPESLRNTSRRAGPTRQKRVARQSQRTKYSIRNSIDTHRGVRRSVSAINRASPGRDLQALPSQRTDRHSLRDRGDRRLERVTRRAEAKGWMNKRFKNAHRACLGS